VCAAPVVASYLAYYVLRPEGRTNYGTLIQPSRALPDLPLVDLDGRSVPAKSLHGQWLLLIAGPADCDTACEKRLYAQRQLRAMLGRERDRLDRGWSPTRRRCAPNCVPRWPPNRPSRCCAHPAQRSPPGSRRTRVPGRSTNTSTSSIRSASG
jgi:hypothetical protein